MGLCAPCRRGLSAQQDRRTAGGVLVSAAFLHAGAARRLVHRLKYDGLRSVVRHVAPALARLLPDGAAALVPVPRAVSRRWRHGVDPALELAAGVGDLARLPVRRILRPAFWHPHRSGGPRRRRGVPVYTLRAAAVPSGIVLVDDVMTTGTTLDAAAAAIGDVRHAITLTVAPRRTALRAPSAGR